MTLRWLSLLAALLAVAPSVAEEAGTTPCSLVQVLETRATMRESSAAFTQERQVQYVKEALHSSGRLRYVAPGYLEMVVEAPQPESFVYEDGVLTIDAAGSSRVRQVSVDSDPVLSAMFAALLGTLSGDQEALKSDFHVGFHAISCQWDMSLVPKLKRVLAKVSEVKLRGTDHRIDEAEIVQANGDRTVLRIREQE